MSTEEPQEEDGGGVRVGPGEKRWPRASRLCAPGRVLCLATRERREGDTSCHVGQED